MNGAVSEMAAGNIDKKLKKTCLDSEDILQTHSEMIPTSDAVDDLRKLCLREDHPLPIFLLVETRGPPDDLKFCFACKVATIEKRATASSQKAAQQLAAKKMIKQIQELSDAGTSSENASGDQILKFMNEVNRRKTNTSGTCIMDRHNFFKKMDTNKRMKVYQIFRSDTLSSKDKVDLALKTLEIPYKIKEIPSKKKPIVSIELDCDLDVVVAGWWNTVYDKMIEYLQDMMR